MKVSISGTETINVFQLTAVFSMLFALVGFSYNVWRMEITEYNNVRSASFELLLQLSDLESIIYAALLLLTILNMLIRKGNSPACLTIIVSNDNNLCRDTLLNSKNGCAIITVILTTIPIFKISLDEPSLYLLNATSTFTARTYFHRLIYRFHTVVTS